MGGLVRPDVCNLLYTNLQSLPNIKRLFINPTKLKIESIFCNNPKLCVRTRCIRYGTIDYVDFDYDNRPWINLDKDVVLGKHLTLAGDKGTLHINTLDLCYALLQAYLNGYVEKSNRSRVLSLVERTLNGTKPSCKNYFNNYSEHLVGIDLQKVSIKDIVGILYGDILFHHCEFVEVRIDVQTILTEINSLIIPSNKQLVGVGC